ncbi:MAG: hypothetical protein ACJ741_09065 [Pyrinomonadaceae bacterium]
MSCQDFDSMSVELARGSLIDAAARESALAHAAACVACDARLRREHVLSAALGEVAAAMRGAEAPARVEGALLAAFRERRSATPQVTFESVRARREASVLTTVRRRALVSAAVAASLVVASVVAWRAFSAKTQQGASEIPKSVAVNVVTTDANQTEARPTDTNPTPDVQPTATQVLRPGRTTLASYSVRRPAPRRATQSVDDLPISFKEHAGRVYADAVASNGAQGGGDLGGSADFVPLMTADSSAPLEGGQMVRVQVPRAALAAWGLPFNAERAGESVKADLLLAHDGTARAIRLRPDAPQQKSQSGN